MADIRCTAAEFVAKMNGANFGDRLIVGNGQVRGAYIPLKPGVDVQAENPLGVEFIAEGNACVFKQPDGGKNKFSQSRFNGGAFDFAGRSRLDLDWNTFTEFSRGQNPGAGQALKSGTHGGGWRCDGSIHTNNTFDDPTGWAIGMWTMENYTAKFNIFRCANGIKADAFQEFHRNVHVEQNLYESISRMGNEWQGRGQDIYFQFNYFWKPKYPSAENTKHCLGWSHILHGRDQRDLFYRYNTMDARDDGGEFYTRLMFEMGNATLCEHNLCLNVGTFTSTYMGDSSGDVPAETILDAYIRNNKLTKTRYGEGGAYGPYASKAHYSNNIGTVVLPPEIKGIGVVPGPGKDITTGTTFPPPDTLPPDNGGGEVPDDSPDDTYITPGGTIHAGSHSYTIKDRRIAVDNVRDGNGGDVLGVLWYGGKIYKDQGASWWVAKNNPPAVGEQYLATTDPRVTTPPPTEKPSVTITVAVKGDVDVKIVRT